jgi:hypothetical protein
MSNAASGPTYVGTGSNGMFALMFSYGVRDATDGNSNTVAFSEALVGRNNLPTAETTVVFSVPSMANGQPASNINAGPSGPP